MQNQSHMNRFKLNKTMPSSKELFTENERNKAKRKRCGTVVRVRKRKKKKEKKWNQSDSGYHSLKRFV